MDTTIVRQMALRRVVDEFVSPDDSEERVAEVLRRADHAARKIARDVHRLQVGQPRSNPT